MGFPWLGKGKKPHRRKFTKAELASLGRLKYAEDFNLPEDADCVRMATELGVDEVALMQTERTVPRWDPGRAQSKIDRLTRIASEAAAQSERSDVPFIHSPELCQVWLDRVPANTLGVVFGARTDARLDALDEVPEQVWCAIGPEGGFTDQELEAFRGAGFAVVSLGNLVLRVETAVPAAIALVRDRVADLLQPR